MATKTTKTTKANKTTVEYNPKTPIGKLYARLVANPGGISKEKLYKGIENAKTYFAWIKIHGTNFGTWRIANLKSGNVKIVFAGNDKKTTKKAA